MHVNESRGAAYDADEPNRTLESNTVGALMSDEWLAAQSPRTSRDEC